MDLPDRRSNPEVELGRQEMSAVLHREIHRLPPLLRNVLIMRDLDEVAIDDVAARLGISTIAAKTRLRRARVELRQRLARLCIVTA
jgi:RNA polymerase sigma-70 factor (ECF subfamily)